MKKIFGAIGILILSTIPVSCAGALKTQKSYKDAITISLNGVDNVGKTTQMQLLPLDSSVQRCTSIHYYDPVLGGMMQKKRFDEWWWHAKDEDFIKGIFDALKKRFKQKSTSAKSIVFDRGMLMFEAVCIARIAQKNNLSLEAAEKKYLKIKATIKNIPKEQFSILLTHGKSLKTSISLSLKRQERKPDKNYTKYQTLLQKYIQKQIKRGLYHVVIHCEGLSPAQVQDKIRSSIRSKFPQLKAFFPFFPLKKQGKHVLLNAKYLLDHTFVLPAYEKIDQEHTLLHQLNQFLNAHYWISSFSLSGLSPNLYEKLNFMLGYKIENTPTKDNPKTKINPKIVAFGGLSECGKSTFASMTCQKYKGQSARLKIGYLLGHPSVYQKSHLEQAKILAHHLKQFAKFHPWIKCITIESLHSAKSTQTLKKILGDELVIVYLDVPLKLRNQRSSETIDLIRKKDQVKKSRGAHLIKSFADILHLNTDPNLTSSFEAFFQAFCKKTGKNLNTVNSSMNTKKGLIGTKGQLLSREFVLSAGAVIFNQKLNKICLVQNKKGEFFLPKGRKNVGESLEQTALREAYEETGFRCKLLPATMPSRATPATSSKKHIPDVVRICKEATEPLAISMRPGPDHNQKIIFWFLAVAEGKYDQNTQMENEDFSVHFYTFKEALAKLTFENDIKLVQLAIQIVQIK